MTFYSGYTLEKVADLTVMEFNVLMETRAKIIEMENPDSKPKAEPGVIPNIPPGFNNFIQKKE